MNIYPFVIYKDSPWPGLLWVEAVHA